MPGGALRWPEVRGAARARAAVHAASSAAEVTPVLAEAAIGEQALLRYETAETFTHSCVGLRAALLVPTCMRFTLRWGVSHWHL